MKESLEGLTQAGLGGRHLPAAFQCMAAGRARRGAGKHGHLQQHVTPSVCNAMCSRWHGAGRRALPGAAPPAGGTRAGVQGWGRPQFAGGQQLPPTGHPCIAPPAMRGPPRPTHPARRSGPRPQNFERCACRLPAPPAGPASVGRRPPAPRSRRRQGRRSPRPAGGRKRG